MRALPICLIALVTFVGAGMAASADPPVVNAPKVLPDGCVDTTGVGAIVEHFFKDAPGRPKRSDEQKVLAFYHWFRRVIYPFRNMGSDRRDVLKAINTAGCDLCGSQAGVALAILREAGYDCRAVQGNGGKEWGHTFWEVKYDDRWHLFDAMTAFYVRTRAANGAPGPIASGQEIMDDPTLVTQAQAEGRCGTEFLYTMRNHEITLAERERFQAETNGKDVPWSLLVTRPGSLLDFWTTIAKKKKIGFGKLNSTYGGHVTPGVLDIRLKANESYVRLWEGQGKWLVAPSFPKYPPANMAAGGNERFDAVNFRYFEPYRKEKPNPFNDAVYRTYANGWLLWQPESFTELNQGAEGITNFKAADDGTLTVADPAKIASLLLGVKSPYGVVEIELALLVNQPAGATTRVWWETGQSRNDRLIYRNAKQAFTLSDASSAVHKIVVSTVDLNPSLYDYRLKVEVLKGAGATVAVRSLKTTFQCSPMALPGLLPGENKVRVTAAERTRLPGDWYLKVRYNWLEAPDWKKHAVDVQRLAELPASYTIKLAEGEKLPRMTLLEIGLFHKPPQVGPVPLPKMPPVLPPIMLE